ncbi:MAG: hypothetical protein ACI8ZM_000500 [Crocinitomix sp.]|jgi:hypothetical protein
MAIEIKELEIKAALIGQDDNNKTEECKLEKEEIIEECIDRVLQILKDKMEL